MALSLTSKLPAFVRFSSHHHVNVRLSSNSTQHYDIIISGGGMVGFAMACSLGEQFFGYFS